MKNNVEQKVTVNGLDFIGLLTVVLIALKLTGFITWSWVWVLAPLWIGLIFTIVILGTVAVFIWWIER